MPDFSKYQPPAFTPLDILYQDEHLIAVNKPSGLLSVPGRGDNKRDCMLSRLQEHYPQALVIHRLDMPTSGVILFALNKTMQSLMSKLFTERKMYKEYIARVYGIVREKKGSINQPLITNWSQRPRQKIDYKHGKSALTHYQHLSDNLENNSLLKLMPVTGRSHQLRVHLSSLGHPILGDELYGTAASRNASERLLLHASYIRFKHPIINQLIKIKCPINFL